MIRFQPDSLFEAVMRPFALAWPESGVYTEIIAPDFRFAFVLVFLGIAFVANRRGLRSQRGLCVLLALTVLASVPWLATTGNGRYFMPFLVVAGPLAVGAATLLPGTKSLKLAAALAMLAWQGFLVSQIEPWHSWSQVEWESTVPFPIEVPADVASTPRVFVTISSISYSIIAPQFHPDSRWINISALPVRPDAPDAARARSVIDSRLPLDIIFPTIPGGQKADRIDPELALGIDRLLAVQNLSIGQASQCRLLPSEGMKGFLRRHSVEPDPSMVHGFWLCPGARHANPAALKETALPERTESVFRRLEAVCPRIFPPGEAVSLRLPEGAVRAYPGSDFKLYVMDNGQVLYKYYRALNAVIVGKVDEVLSPRFTMDCNHVRGRGGLPWDRSI